MNHDDLREFELLVATMNRSQPPDVLRALGPGDERPAVLYLNQCTTIPPPALIEGPSFRMLSFAERGLSRSRNRALDAARARVVVLGDDDLCYRPDLVPKLRRAFSAHPDATAITFQFVDERSGQAIKAYRSHAFRHGMRSIASVSSVEIALRLDRLAGLRFDTRFGLGAELEASEEAIFLADLLRAGHALYYWPEVLCSHPGPSSGHRPLTRETAFAKGAAFRRIYGAAWPAAALYFAIAKRRLYRDELGLAEWLWHTTRGGLEKLAEP